MIAALVVLGFVSVCVVSVGVCDRLLSVALSSLDVGLLREVGFPVVGCSFYPFHLLSLSFLLV